MKNKTYNWKNKKGLFVTILKYKINEKIVNEVSLIQGILVHFTLNYLIIMRPYNK